ncbi:MAG: CoA-binding protein [Elusimicrobiota bacterium]|jgi:predicted CoA-binding protein|nr:CoA-binding protein [Elusimicrobiota bacterium]
MYKDKKIAVIGVSENTQKFGYRIFMDLLTAGFSVMAVGRGGNIRGIEIYKSLDALLSKPDLVITVVPPQVTEQIVKDCIRLNIKEIWCQPGSKSQIATQEAQKAGIKITIDECFMVSNGIWKGDSCVLPRK